MDGVRLIVAFNYLSWGKMKSWIESIANIDMDLLAVISLVDKEVFATQYF